LAGEHEVEVARYCAQLSLESCGQISRNKLPAKPDFSPNRTQYLKEVRKGLERVEGRLVDILATSHVDLLGWIPARILKPLVQGRLEKLGREGPSPLRYELRLEVPSRKFEFDGQGWGDRDQKPRRIGGRFYLITFATFHPEEEKAWSGPHISRKKQLLRLDRDGKGGIGGRAFCTVALPERSTLEEGRTLPYPVLVARVRKSDKGGRIEAGRWTVVDMIEGLEGTILE
jgi:hypothetical protein